MIKEFVERFEQNKAYIEGRLSEQHPESYENLVKIVVGALKGDDEYSSPDPERIHAIDDGNYQGTLVFVIASGGYQPSTYWYVKVSYGSCSGCDTLEAIRSYEDGKPGAQQLADYMSLALHIVQGLKLMGDEEE